MHADDIVVTLDADGQHDAKDIPLLVAPLVAGEADMVVGRRSFEKYPRIKRFGNWVLSGWASFWAGVYYEDAECGFRACRLDVLLDLLPYFNPVQYGLDQEMDVIVARRGWRVRNDVPIAILRYRAGARVFHGLNNAASAIRAWYRVRFNHTVHHRPVWSDVLVGGDAIRLQARYREWGIEQHVF